MMGTARAYRHLAGHIGDAETLLDDSVRYAERATNVDVRLDIWEGMPHVLLTSV